MVHSILNKVHGDARSGIDNQPRIETVSIGNCAMNYPPYVGHPVQTQFFGFGNLGLQGNVVPGFENPRLGSHPGPWFQLATSGNPDEIIHLHLVGPFLSHACVLCSRRF